MIADLIPRAATVAVDEMTGAMRRAQVRLFPAGAPLEAAAVVNAAQLVKTPDEVACIRKACRITEEAIVDVQKALAPGVRQIDLSARFVRRAFELGATANMLEAIWQVMPSSRADGAWTTHGDLALPLLPTERELQAGDVLWTDVSITYGGCCSDFGRTWLVGEKPSARQQDVFAQWRAILDAVLAVTKAGVTSGDLARAAIAANGGRKPWLPHFYLGHGIGTYPAETPMIGTDLGEEFDDNFVFSAGMVLVLEPGGWMAPAATAARRSWSSPTMAPSRSPTTPTRPMAAETAGVADEVFHPAGDDEHCCESGWFGFAIPERDINGFVYYFHDVRTGISGGGPHCGTPAASRSTIACSTTGAGTSRRPARWYSGTSGFRIRFATKCSNPCAGID